MGISECRNNRVARPLRLQGSGCVQKRRPIELPLTAGCALRQLLEARRKRTDGLVRPSPLSKHGGQERTQPTGFAFALGPCAEATQAHGLAEPTSQQTFAVKNGAASASVQDASDPTPKRAPQRVVTGRLSARPSADGKACFRVTRPGRKAGSGRPYKPRHFDIAFVLPPRPVRQPEAKQPAPAPRVDPGPALSQRSPQSQVARQPEMQLGLRTPASASQLQPSASAGTRAGGSPLPSRATYPHSKSQQHPAAAEERAPTPGTQSLGSQRASPGSADAALAGIVKWKLEQARQAKAEQQMRKQGGTPDQATAPRDESLGSEPSVVLQDGGDQPSSTGGADVRLQDMLKWKLEQAQRASAKPDRVVGAQGGADQPSPTGGADVRLQDVLKWKLEQALRAKSGAGAGAQGGGEQPSLTGGADVRLQDVLKWKLEQAQRTSTKPDRVAGARGGADQPSPTGGADVRLQDVLKWKLEQAQRASAKPDRGAGARGGDEQPSLMGGADVRLQDILKWKLEQAQRARSEQEAGVQNCTSPVSSPQAPDTLLPSPLNGPPRSLAATFHQLHEVLQWKIQQVQKRAEGFRCTPGHASAEDAAGSQGVAGAGEAAAALVSARVLAPAQMATTTPCRGPLASPQSVLRAHETPMEGVPERMIMRATPVPCKQLPRTPQSCTPIEGVPERLPKRQRLTPLAGFVWRPHATNGNDRPATGLAQAASPPGSLLAPVGKCVAQSPCAAAKAEGDAGGAGQGGAGATNSDNVTGELPEAVAAVEGGTGCGTISDHPEDEDMPDAVAPGMTAAEAAAGAVEAARRVRVLVGYPSGSSAGPSPSVAPPSSSRQVTPREPSASRQVTPGESSCGANGNTPAVVKVHNIGEAVMNAVQRAAAAMGGMPSGRVARPSRPPLPPAVSSRGTTPAAGSGGRVADAGMQHPTPGTSGGPQSVENFIHRAPPDALLFPSRTPSPYGFGWPSAARGAAPVAAAGTSPVASTATPTTDPKADSLIGRSIPAASTGPPGGRPASVSFRGDAGGFGGFRTYAPSVAGSDGRDSPADHGGGPADMDLDDGPAASAGSGRSEDEEDRVAGEDIEEVPGADSSGADAVASEEEVDADTDEQDAEAPADDDDGGARAAVDMDSQGEESEDEDEGEDEEAGGGDGGAHTAVDVDSQGEGSEEEEDEEEEAGGGDGGAHTAVDVDSQGEESEEEDEGEDEEAVPHGTVVGHSGAQQHVADSESGDEGEEEEEDEEEESQSPALEDGAEAAAVDGVGAVAACSDRRAQQSSPAAEEGSEAEEEQSGASALEDEDEAAASVRGAPAGSERRTQQTAVATMQGSEEEQEEEQSESEEDEDDNDAGVRVPAAALTRQALPAAVDRGEPPARGGHPAAGEEDEAEQDHDLGNDRCGSFDDVAPQDMDIGDDLPPPPHTGGAAAPPALAAVPGPSLHRHDDDGASDDEGGGFDDEAPEDMDVGDDLPPLPHTGNAAAAAPPALAAAPVPSFLRHDDDDDSDDEGQALNDVRSLPDHPATGGKAFRDSTAAMSGPKSVGNGGSQGVSGGARSRGDSESRGHGQAESGRKADGGSSAAAAQGPPQQETRGGQRPSESHEQERRLAGKRKSLAGIGLVVSEEGTRRSTRNRTRPLEYWRGEVKTYGRDHKSLITVKAIKLRTPEPQWPLPSGRAGEAKRKARTKLRAQEEPGDKQQ